MTNCKNPNCNKEIQPSNRKKVFCSRQCANEWHNKICRVWQPIETAPKDGDLILALTDLNHMKLISWQRNPISEVNKWFESTGSNTYKLHELVKLTHWLPIPNLPK